MRRFVLFFVAPSLLVLGLVVLPLVLGGRTLYLRDVMNAHLPLKAAQAEALRQGELPLVDPHRGGGQPQLGNPNGLPLYPDDLLLLAADPLWVTNAHFWLHWLLAPFAFYWLARALGLSRPGAWSAGLLYATGGYFFSLLNLYNLVAIGAVAPAFLAAALDAAAPVAVRPPRAWRWPLAALLFALLLLAGDPFSALLTLALLLLAIGLRDGRRALLRPSLELPAALALGFLVSLPMWVEMLRILPASFRSAIRAVQSASLTQSVHPLQGVEALFPLFFGRFDLSFWGAKIYDQGEPLIVSYFPGLLALALLPLAFRRAAAGGEERSAAWRFGWIAAALGLFCALGRYNPLMLLFYQLPGAGLLRFPVKFLLFTAVGLALLGGLAAERLLEGDAWRRLRPLLLLALAAYGAVFAVVLIAPPLVDALLRGLSGGLPEPLVAYQRVRLGATAATLAALAVVMLLATLLARRSPKGALSLLLLLHAVSQVVLLESLTETDDAAFYRAPPALDAQLPPEARIAHAAFAGESFGPLALDPRKFPDFRQLWQARCLHEELGAPTGILRGRQYELNFSPEGLDSYYSVFFGKWLAQRSDADRVRALAAAGVDYVLLPRPLEGVAPEEATAVTEFTSSCQRTLAVYRLERALPPLALLGNVRRAASAGEAAELQLADDFDPRRDAILPARQGGGGPLAAPAGKVELIRDERETVEATVESAGGGVLATRRAFLPLYRAEIDGRPARPELLNGHRLGVEVPAGRHQVRLYADRTPTRIAMAVALAALAWLAFRAFRRAA